MLDLKQMRSILAEVFPEVHSEVTYSELSDHMVFSWGNEPLCQSRILVEVSRIVIMRAPELRNLLQAIRDRTYAKV